MSDNTTNITRDEDITRDEQWLADIRTAAQGGSDYYELNPIIRKEYYYSDIITALKNGGGGGGGTSDYTQLTNKPEINGTTLTGNKTGSDLGLQDKVLGSWTAGTATTHSTPTSTDTVLEALQKIDNNQRNDETNISLLAAHFSFTENSGHYYLQPEQPSNPQDGDIWIS